MKTKILEILTKVGRNTHLLEKESTWVKHCSKQIYSNLKTNHMSIREHIFIIIRDTHKQTCNNPKCSKFVKFISIGKGYHKYCSRSCGVTCQTTVRSKIGKLGIEKRRELAKCDSEYFKRSSPASVLFWTERGFTLQQATQKVSERQSTFSKKICITKHGQEKGTEIWQARQDKWQQTLNSKSPEEKRKINESKNSFLNKTVDEKVDILLKRRNTAEGNGFWLPVEELDDYEIYGRLVWSTTRKQQLEDLKYIGHRGHIKNNQDAYHLDHKFSIREGFMRGIPPHIIGSICNLEMLPALDNISKNSRCSISEAHLFETFQQL